MSVFKRWNGTSWETIGTQITSNRFNKIDNMIAPSYSANSTYSIGDYVIHDDTLYKCNTNISTAETWTPAHWTSTTIMAEVLSLIAASSSS